VSQRRPDYAMYEKRGVPFAGPPCAVWFLYCVALLWSTVARAGSPVYHRHDFSNLADSACPTGAPGNAPDGYPWGISLSGLQGWTANICPLTEGAYLTGAGSIHVCTYSATPWGPGSWALAPRFTWTMGASDATTADNPCFKLEDVPVYVDLSDRVFVYPSTDFGVSSGGVSVYLYGSKRPPQ
jgi:hypothetical protein